MPRTVYIAGVGLTKVDLTGRIFETVFDLFAQAVDRALLDSPVHAFDALQIGIMGIENFESRANIAAKIADRLGLTGIPAVRSETASSSGAAAFHEAYYKIASGACESALVVAGERMKTVTTQVATTIVSRTVDPVERRFGFTMPALIALITQAWFRERGVSRDRVPEILSRLMVRAHALGAANPLAAFFGRPEPRDAYFSETQNQPVATPLTRKDCSPICDGAAAVILTAKPQAVQVAGLGSATETSSILDRERLSGLDATRQAAQLAYCQAGIADPKQLDRLVVEAHDAFNSLLPINLIDLGLAAPEEAIDCLLGGSRNPSADPLTHPTTGIAGRIPTNLSGGLKARGHPVGGTGLFQIAETFLQLTQAFPNGDAQVRDPGLGLAHSIGGPGNNVYVTILERSDSRRRRTAVRAPRRQFQRRAKPRADDGIEALHGARAVVEAATTIHVTSGQGSDPIHVALLRIDGRRVFARLDQPADEEQPIEEVMAGQKALLLVKGDGDQYFRIPRGRGFDLGRVVRSIRRRVGSAGGGEGSER